MGRVTDFDRVESFTRNVYADKTYPHSTELMWMHKTAVAAHLMALGAQKTTVLSAFLSRILLETKTDIVLLSNFVDSLDSNGDVIMENIVDITATHKNPYRPIDLIQKSFEDRKHARNHLFLTDVLFYVRAHTRINFPIEEERVKIIKSYVKAYEEAKRADLLTLDLLDQIKREIVFLHRIEKASNEHAYAGV